MTFEEFFAKKRIDLTLLQRVEPALYDEFREHYSQMSEKSFDHTKKYWFNRLRKDFLLDVVETPKVAVEKTAVTGATETSAPTATRAKPTGLSSTSPSGFKPRFKAAAVKSVADTETSSETPSEGTPATAKPIGFKPRFKAPAAKTAPDPTAPPEETPGATTGTKPTNLPASSDLQTPPVEATQPDTEPGKPVSGVKPLGFKPRFKAGVTDASKPNAEAEEAEKEKPEPVPEPTPGTASKPLGFKPRFKAGSTPPKKDDAT